MKEGSERAELKVHCMLRRRRGLVSQPHSIDAVSHISASCNPTRRLKPTSYGTVAVSLLALANIVLDRRNGSCRLFKCAVVARFQQLV